MPTKVCYHLLSFSYFLWGVNLKCLMFFQGLHGCEVQEAAVGLGQVLYHQKLLEWHRRLFQRAGWVACLSLQSSFLFLSLACGLLYLCLDATSFLHHTLLKWMVLQLHLQGGTWTDRIVCFALTLLFSAILLSDSSSLVLCPLLGPCAEAELLEEEAEMNQGGGDIGKMGVLRRRRRTYSRTLPEHMKPNKQYGQDPEQDRDGNMGTWRLQWSLYITQADA